MLKVATIGLCGLLYVSHQLIEVADIHVSFNYIYTLNSVEAVSLIEKHDRHSLVIDVELSL